MNLYPSKLLIERGKMAINSSDTLFSLKVKSLAPIGLVRKLSGNCGLLHLVGYFRFKGAQSIPSREEAEKG